MDARVSLPVQATCEHGCYTATGPQNYVDWHRNIVAESVVVQNINTKKEHNVDQPATDGYLIGLDEKWRVR